MKIDVSDHALIRWLERVKGVDMEALRSEIRASIAPAVAAGATAVERGGMRFTIEKGVLTTVMPARHRKYKAWKEKLRATGGPRRTAQEDFG